jgi:hypothetical protein
MQLAKNVIDSDFRRTIWKPMLRLAAYLNALGIDEPGCDIA